MNILFIVFNRPEETQEVFAAIRKARPQKLFIAADGPRKDRLQEKERCEAVRALVSKVDWPCQVETRFQENNLGCKKHVSSAITWFFDHVEEGIILEDDTVPDQSFFPFMQAMLDIYKNDERIMHVSGTTFVPREYVSDHYSSYHFSRYVHVWGWATWRRAWKHYDLGMQRIDDLEKDTAAFGRDKDRTYWVKFFRHIQNKHVDTWDAQWQYSVRSAKGLCITTDINVVRNIGFGNEATHTKDGEPAHMETRHMAGIVTPKHKQIDEKADAYLMDTIYIQNFLNKVLTKLHYSFLKLKRNLKV